MKEKLTKRQQQVLTFIKNEVRRKGYPPSVREIGAALGMKSSATVHNHLAKLEEKNYIRRDPTKPRAIEILDESFQASQVNSVGIPVIGKVTAGTPILAVENIEEYFPLPADFVKDDEVFMLQVKGDSMINKGIHDGDYVIVRKQSTANNYDIVVALIDDEATVKTYILEPDGIRLQPANPAYEPIIRKDVRILGKVIGIFRKL